MKDPAMIILLALVSIPASAQLVTSSPHPTETLDIVSRYRDATAVSRDVLFRDYLLWGNSQSPNGPGRFIQTTSGIVAPEWERIFPPGYSGAGDVLCFEGVTSDYNDGCYTVQEAIYGTICDACRFIILREDPPHWQQNFSEWWILWIPGEVFDDGFESGSTSSWSSTVGARGF